ncbi:hypothetical protein F4821DRAFT_224333 [Hypoxylon rubiginosum]|uniref:Uncharacterized protein n=1 Tax=Hypoxylon rubiginosum TaxID=110542 RepID=A0ACC0DK35_9PEZI|nr:hypothetical protein F4821DRAFT_224333 [Hypoxylon rubiginosum]
MGDLVKQNFLNDCKRLNLLDEEGNPVPNAKAELRKLGKKGRPKAQRINTDITEFSSSEGESVYGSSSSSSSRTTITPSSACYPVTPLLTYNDITPSTPGTPPGAPPGAPVSAASWPGGLPSPFIQQQFYPSPPQQYSPSQQYSFPQQQAFPQEQDFLQQQDLLQQPSLQQPPPIVHSSQKRTHDEMYMEDQQIDGQATVQGIPAEGNPPKRPHIEEPTAAAAVDTGAAVYDNFGMWEAGVEGTFDSFNPLDSNPLDSSHEGELDLALDHEAGFDVIDKEIPGKSSPVLSINEDGFDLFGDAETPAADEEALNVDSSEVKEPPGELRDTEEQPGGLRDME